MTKAEQEATNATLRAAIVDEYGTLAAEVMPWKQKVTRVEELAKIIRSWHAEDDAEATFTVSGKRYQAALGVKQLCTRIDIKEAWRAMGRKQFLLAATLTLKALEAHLPADKVATLVSKERTGTRSLQVSLIAAYPQILKNGDALV